MLVGCANDMVYFGVSKFVSYVDIKKGKVLMVSCSVYGLGTRYARFFARFILNVIKNLRKQVETNGFGGKKVAPMVSGNNDAWYLIVAPMDMTGKPNS